VLRDLVEAAEATGAERVGLVGFCMGGMYALKAAGLGRFDRIVSFYGMIRCPRSGAATTTASRSTSSPGLARRRSSPSWAAATLHTATDVAALEFAGARVVRYPTADHGFVHDASRPNHRVDDAADAWQRAWALPAGLTSPVSRLFNVVGRHQTSVKARGEGYLARNVSRSRCTMR
jgi:carboxymethylenebutenolidase